MGNEKHPKKVEILLSKVVIVERPGSGGTIEKLVSIEPGDCAKAAANMSYDSARDFTEIYADEFRKQAESDTKKGRVRLPVELSYVIKYLKSATEALNRAWGISEKYMR